MTLIVLAGCASATPLPPTLTVVPTVSFTATAPPTQAASATTMASATVPPTLALSPTLAASATEAPTATVAATATPAATLTPLPPTAKPTAAEFTPQVVSVWDTELAPVTDNMQGTCSAPTHPAYGPVEITPQGNTLLWKSLEPAPYTLTRVRSNLWQAQYSGPTSTGDGTLTIVVQFTSPTTLLLTRTFVATAEPNCTHVHTYTGVFKWNK